MVHRKTAPTVQKIGQIPLIWYDMLLLLIHLSGAELHTQRTPTLAFAAHFRPLILPTSPFSRINPYMNAGDSNISGHNVFRIICGTKS